MPTTEQIVHFKQKHVWASKANQIDLGYTILNRHE